MEAYLNQEGSIREVAQRFKVSRSDVQTLLKRVREGKTLAPKKVGGNVTPRLAKYEEEIKEWVQENPDAILQTSPKISNPVYTWVSGFSRSNENGQGENEVFRV